MHWDNYDLNLQHRTPVPNIRGMPSETAPLARHPSDDSLINNKIIVPEDYNDPESENSDGVDSDYVGDSEVDDQKFDELDEVSDYPDPPEYNDLVNQDNTAYNEYSLPRPVQKQHMYNLHPNSYLPQYSLENSQNDLDHGGPTGVNLNTSDLDALGFPLPGNYGRNDYDISSPPALDNMSMSGYDGLTSANGSMSDISQSEEVKICEIEDSEANLSAEESADESAPLSQDSRSHTHTAV